VAVAVASAVAALVGDGKMNILEGIKLFNDGNYFEAHDYFEELWMNSTGSYSEFYKALVQISVGSFHLISKNLNGALNQYFKGVEKLQKFPNNFENIRLLQFRQDINFLINEIKVFYSKKIYNFKVTKIPFIELNT